MTNWKNRAKTVVTTGLLVGALLVQGGSVMNQGRELLVEEPIVLTQYATPQPTDSVDNTGQIQSDITSETTDSADNTEGWNEPEATLDAQMVNNAAEFRDEEILYSSYYSYGSGCLFVEMVKTDLDVTTNGAVAASMGNSGVASSQQLLDACLSEEEKQELMAGGNKEIRVTMKQMVLEGLSDSQYELLDQAKEEYSKTYKGFQVGSYIKINISKKNEEGKWKKVKLNNDIKFYMDIPAISQVSEAKGYYLLQMRSGKYFLTEDEDSYLETLTASVSGSAMCAICYTLPAAEVTPTITPAAQLTYWQHLNSGEFCVWHWFDAAIMIIGVTWLLAIDRKKIRIVFLTVMSILSVVLGIMGQCVYDLPFTIGTIALLVLIHIGKTFLQKKKRR